MYPDLVPYKDPEDRRIHDRANAPARRERERAQYASDDETKAKKKAYAKAYYEANREKVKARARERRALDPTYQHSRNLARYGGLDFEAWTQMLISQSGRCAVCFDPMKSPCVDHDHSCCSGKKTCGKCTRALVCEGCNHGLGKFRDDPVRLRAAAAYLEQFAI